MTIFRRGRYIFWIAKELFDKYTKAIVGGIAVGAIIMFLLQFFYPTLIMPQLSPVERIGVVGEFTPSTLPLSIQQKLSIGLTTIGPDGNPLSGLANQWEATDSGTTYIFKLRSDLLWPDGKTVVSSDINYSIKDVTLLPSGDTTLVVRLKEPYSPFPTVVSKPILRRGLVGFGTYRLSDISLKGDFIQYIRINSKDDKPMTSTEYRFFRTEAAAITAYKLGDIDKISDISQATELTGWKNTSVNPVTKYDQIVAVFFNLQDPILTEKSVRQALGYAMPETSYERAYSPINKNSWAYTDKIRKYTRDLEQARTILSNAKIDLSGKEIVLTTFPQYVDVAQSISQSWKELGLTTKVKIENTLPDNFQALLSAQNLPPDPDQYPLWHSTQQNTNVTKYSNVKIDKLLEDARKEFDIDTRKKLYADFQRFLVEDAPAIFYFYPTKYTISRT